MSFTSHDHESACVLHCIRSYLVKIEPLAARRSGLPRTLALLTGVNLMLLALQQPGGASEAGAAGSPKRAVATVRAGDRIHCRLTREETSVEGGALVRRCRCRRVPCHGGYRCNQKPAPAVLEHPEARPRL